MTDPVSPLLVLNHVHVWFPLRRGVLARTRGYIKAVNDVSLEIYPGETVGLVGESGCGKSTLGRCIVGLEKIRSGEILFHGYPIQSIAQNRNLRRQIQMIFQDPGSSLNPRLTVQEIISEGLQTHQLVPKKEREKEVIRWLQEVGMDETCLWRYPHEFSGGQRQRICIARVLALQPQLIVCDEIVSALDVSIQAQILNLLIGIREKFKTSFLFISHDLSVVRHLSHRVAVMYLGKIVELGPTEEVITSPQHPYTIALLSALPSLVPGRRRRIILEGDVPSLLNPPQGCPFHPRCPFAKEVCRETLPDLQKRGTRWVRCHFYNLNLPPS